MTDAQYQNEILEAIEAANVALRALHNAETDLKSAGGWGIFDILGGGMITSMIKHSNMNSAQKHMNEARYALQKFSKELRDVDEDLDFQFDNMDFMSFADVFMDNGIIDFMVQSQIEDAKKQVRRAIRRVEEIKDQLSRM